MFSYCFLILFIFFSITNGLEYFRKLEIERQAALLQKQPSNQDLWLQQKLDNFRPSDQRTWLQRYFMQKAFDKPNGPVFLQIGGEGPANIEWMTQGHWITLAQRFGAICFFLEHRFYGKSHPTSDTSDENLAYLSSEQALADVANFIANVTIEQNLQGRKWIVIGGSYSGALSVWARLKYPHLVAGAISSSAPLNALVNFAGYLEVVKHSLTKFGSQSCVNNIEKATQQVASNLNSDEGRKLLASYFNLCKPLDGTSLDDAYFQQALAGNIMGVVQYNKDNREFEGGLAGNVTIETVCSTMDNSLLGSPLQRYAHFNQIILTAYKQECLDASYTGFIEDMRSTSWSGAVGGRSWLYQTCTEFGWYQTTESSSQPFVGFNLDFSLDQCKSIFGLTPDQVREAVTRTNENYGALKLVHIVNNVTLYNGGVDPWSNVSFDGQTYTKKFHRGVSIMDKADSGITPIFVPDTAHCAIMYPASPHDSLLLTQARRLVEEVVASWLGYEQSYKIHF